MTKDERAWPQQGMSLLQAVGGRPWRANAQMYLGPDWVAYQYGYELATRLLLERAASGRDADVLIFPILFNARQAIELALKEIVVIGIRLGHTEPYPMTHDLLTLWVAANGVLVEAGADEEESTTAFEALLHELHVADPVGAGNSAVVVDRPRWGPMLSPRVPNLVPIPAPRMERETPGQRPRPNYGHPRVS